MKIRSVILCVLLGVPFACNCGVMGDLNALVLSNATSASVINTKDRTGVFAGSFEMRAPIKAVNLVAFDAPRLSAGCGGVDLYGGSFSFINGPAIVDTFRKVAQNAAGLAFKAAIKTITPSLDALMTEFQTLMQSLNNLNKNSCQWAHLIVGDEKPVASATSGEGSVAGSINTMFADATAALKSFNADPPSFLKKQAEVNPQSGNAAFKAVIASGATSILELAGISNVDGTPDDATSPNSLNNKILVSFLGYEIGGVPCTSTNVLGVANTTTPTAGAIGNVSCKGPKTLTLDDLVKGGGPGSLRTAKLTLYKCVDPTGVAPSNGGFDPQICTNIQKEDFSYIGVQGWINQNLFGSADTSAPQANSIIGKVNSGSSVSLTSPQIQFIKATGLPVIGLLSKTSNPNNRIAIANKLGLYLNDCITARLGEAIYKAANLVDSNATYKLTDEMKLNIENLRKEYLAKQELCVRDSAVLRIAQELNAVASLTGTTR